MRPIARPLGFLPRVMCRNFPAALEYPTGVASLASQFWDDQGIGTATPQTSPGVRSDYNFEANPAVATRDSQETKKRNRDKDSGISTFSSSDIHSPA
eukprot:5591595-Pyramimonas_sp.AAC.1